MPSVMQTISGNPRVFRFKNRVGGKRRRHKNHRRIRACLFHRVGHRIKHRPAFVGGAAFARRHAAHNLGAIFRTALGVERAFFARDSLNNQSRIIAQPKQTSYAPAFAAAFTTSSAASFIVSPTRKFNPDSLQNLASFFNVRAFEPQHNRHLHIQLPGRGHYAGRQTVYAQNSAKDVDEDRLHICIRQQNLKRVLNLLLRRAAAHIQKIRRASASVLNNVHRRHRQARAVHHAGNGPVQLDVVQRVLARFHFQRIFFGNIAQRLDVRMAEQRVIVERDLRVQRVKLVVLRGDERIDLNQRGIRFHKRLV